MVQRFPPYLLEPSNQVTGDIMKRALEPLAPPAAQVTLFWVRKLQCIKVPLQNKLNPDPYAVHAGWIESIPTKMVNYSRFLKVGKSLSIFTNLCEKTFCRVYLEFSDEFTNQLVLCQLRTIQVTETGGSSTLFLLICLNIG